MPDEVGSQAKSNELDRQAFIQPPIQALADQGPPTPPANGDPNRRRSGADDVAREIEVGERWLIAIGIASVVVNVAIALFYYSQLAEMRRTNSLTQQALDVGNRPWISAEIELKTPLTFTGQGGNVNVTFSMKNVGRSPAINTQYRADIVSLPQKTWMMVELREAEKRECSLVSRRFEGSPLLVPILFPDPEKGFTTGYWPASIANAKIVEALKSSEDGSPSQFPGRISLYIVACIDYQSTFSPQHYQTGYGIELAAPEDSGLRMKLVNPEGVHPDMKMFFLDQFGN